MFRSIFAGVFATCFAVQSAFADTAPTAPSFDPLAQARQSIALAERTEATEKTPNLQSALRRYLLLREAQRWVEDTAIEGAVEGFEHLNARVEEVAQTVVETCGRSPQRCLFEDVRDQLQDISGADNRNRVRASFTGSLAQAGWLGMAQQVSLDIRDGPARARAVSAYFRAAIEQEETEAAQAALVYLMDIVDRIDGTQNRAYARLDIVWAMFSVGQDQDAFAQITHLRRDINTIADPFSRAIMMGESAFLLAELDYQNSSRAVLQELVELGAAEAERDNENATLGSISSFIASGYAVLGDYEDAERGAALDPDPFSRASNLMTIAEFARQGVDIDRVNSLLARVRTEIDQVEFENLQAQLLARLAAQYSAANSQGQAEELFAQAEQIAFGLRRAETRKNALLNIARSYHEADRLEDMRRIVDAALEIDVAQRAPIDTSTRFVVNLLLSMGLVDEAQTIAADMADGFTRNSTIQSIVNSRLSNGQLEQAWAAIHMINDLPTKLILTARLAVFL